LPGVSRVIPEEDLLQCGEKASHVFKLASKQPREAWLAGLMDFITKTQTYDQTIVVRLQPGCGWLLDDVAVAHLHDTPAHCCRFRIVSDHDDRLIEAVIQLLEHVKNES